MPMSSCDLPCPCSSPTQTSRVAQHLQPLALIPETILRRCCRPSTGGPPPRLSEVRRGSQNENIFPHSGGEERRKKKAKPMMIQEAIDKANEGGYHIYGSDGMDTDYEGATNDYSPFAQIWR